MANYDYSCPECGPFMLSRPMAECNEEGLCPKCGTPSPRALLTAPGYSRGPARRENLRQVTKSARGQAHAFGCRCCGSASGRPVAC